MTILARPLVLVAALAALLFTAAPARAQANPDEVLRHCLSEVRSLTHRAVDAIHNRARAGGAELLRLDAANAKDDVMIASARASISDIQGLNRQAHAALQTLTDRCVRALRAAGASDRHMAIFRSAVGAAHSHIDQATHNAIAHIRRVLHYVLNN